MEMCEMRELWKRRTKLLKEIKDIEAQINKGLELDQGTRKTGRKHLSEEDAQAMFRACLSNSKEN